MINHKKVRLWGRELDLEIQYDCYAGEEVLPVQEEALESVLNNWQIVEDAKAYVVKYMLERDGDKIENANNLNVFKYVMPQNLFVGRSKGTPSVYLVCAYRYNEDDGLVVEFVDAAVRQVGTQSII